MTHRQLMITCLAMTIFDANFAQQVFHSLDQPPFPAHIQIGIDKLHQEGIKGQSVKVAVLDTGFDWRQPEFSNIQRGHDWTTDNINDGEEDDDPTTECSQHGTHVLGLIASANTSFGFVGVAPEAEVELHRVFDCDERTREDIFVRALTTAWENGADVIICSWEMSAARHSDNPLRLLVAEIMDSGTYVQFATGNQGPQPMSASWPGAAALVPATGSVDTSYSAAYFWTGSYKVGEAPEETLFWVPGSANDTVSTFSPNLPIYSPFVNDPHAHPYECSHIPTGDELPLMNSTILLVRGDCWTANRDVILNKWKAKYVLIYHNSYDQSFPGPFYEVVRHADAPSLTGIASTTNAVASRLLEGIIAGKSVKVTLTQTKARDAVVSYAQNNITGGRVSKYSAWGPNSASQTGPTFLAPGARILSKFLSPYGGFGQLSGTSMAAPVAAGVAALVKQMHPDYDAHTIRNVLTTTARPVLYNDNSTKSYDLLAPIIQQGGGLIDGYAAVHTNLLVNTSSLEFLDLSRMPAAQSFSVTNTGMERISLAFGHIGAAAGYALAEPYRFANDFDGTLSSSLLPLFAKLTIHPTQAQLGPGASIAVSVRIENLPSLDARRLPFYGGFITINSTGRPEYNHSLPYSGIAAYLPRDVPLIDPTTVRLSISESADQCSHPCVFQLSYQNGTAISPSGALPALSFKPPFTRPARFQIHLLDADTGERVLSEDHEDQRKSDVTQWNWNGSDSRYAHVPAGRYQWQIRYLGLGFNLSDEDAFEIATESFEIKYLPQSMPKLVEDLNNECIDDNPWCPVFWEGD